MGGCAVVFRPKVIRIIVRSLHLTDDDLWRAIANNTDAMSALIEEQNELDAKWTSDPAADKN
jgi:hypothetical protein